MISSKSNPMAKVHFNNNFSDSSVAAKLNETTKQAKGPSQVNSVASYQNGTNIYQLKTSSKSFKNPIQAKLETTHLTKSHQKSQTNQIQIEHLLNEKLSLQKAIEEQKRKNDLIRQTIRNNESIYVMKLEETRKQINILKSKYEEYENEIKQLEMQAMSLGY